MPEISAVNPGDRPLGARGRDADRPADPIHPARRAAGRASSSTMATCACSTFPSDGPVQTYAIGVGRDGFELKFGQTKIVRKTEHPTWYPTESVLRDKPWVGKVVPPGPDNPLGDFAMYLGWPTYLIHGTNKPYGVGRRVSRGCIRMYPEGVAQLYPADPGRHSGHRGRADRQSWVGTRASSILRPSPISCRSTSSRRIRRSRPASGTPEDRQLVMDRAGPERPGRLADRRGGTARQRAAFRCRSPGRERLWPRPVARRAWEWRRLDSNRAVEPADAHRPSHSGTY